MTMLEARTHRGSKFGVLLTASSVSSLIMLDSNVVAVALPTIGRSLHASFAGIQWIISAYLLMAGLENLFMRRVYRPLLAASSP
jgi:MFS family permease